VAFTSANTGKLPAFDVVAIELQTRGEKMDPKCIKCGSAKIIPLVKMIDQGEASDGSLKALVAYTNPEAWVFKRAIYAKLNANICGECGYTELIAEDPAALYDAYRKAKRSR
jgi:predicted nucleic-acid-binding Zn-ribbon protein